MLREMLLLFNAFQNEISCRMFHYAFMYVEVYWTVIYNSK